MKGLLLFLLTSTTFANDLPSQDALNSDQVVSNVTEGTHSSFIPQDRVLSDIRVENKPVMSDREFEEKIQKSKEIITQTTQTVEVKKAAPKRVYAKPKPQPPVLPVVTIPAEVEPTVESGIYVLNAPLIAPDTINSITLPSGSTALATLMAGVEVSTEIRQVDARLDYAFLGPNGAVVELKGCHIWIDVSGNYNTERIYGEGKTISCRTSKGSTFEIQLHAQLRDFKDEYIGKKAELITRGKVAAAAMQFLQSGVSEFGKAMAAAQVQTDLSSGGVNSNPQTASNVQGSDARYIMGKSIAGASAGFLDWWIDYYKGLSPTLAMAPGSKIFLTIKGEIQIPQEFFIETKLDQSTLIRNNTANTLSPQGDSDEKN
ncbi:MAG: hypothetical protein AB7I27_14025 [Bacteriovoracaceae bacterium]